MAHEPETARLNSEKMTAHEPQAEIIGWRQRQRLSRPYSQSNVIFVFFKKKKMSFSFHLKRNKNLASLIYFRWMIGEKCGHKLVKKKM